MNAWFLKSIGNAAWKSQKDTKPTLPDHGQSTTFPARRKVSESCEKLVSAKKKLCSKNKLQPRLIKHHSTYRHPSNSPLLILTRKKTNVSRNAWLVTPFSSSAWEWKAEYGNTPCRPLVYWYVCNASRNVQS